MSIGQKNFGRNRGTLEADATAIIALAQTDMLKNSLSTDAAAAQTALDNWKTANKGQHDAQDNYAHAVQALRDMVDLINAARRTIQTGTRGRAARAPFQMTELSCAVQKTFIWVVLNDVSASPAAADDAGIFAFEPNGN